MIKIGIESTAYITDKNYTEGIKKMKEHGYDCMDFRDFMCPDSEFYSMDQKQFVEYFSEFRKAADCIGVNVWQMHSMWPQDDTTEKSRALVIEKSKLAIKAAGILGCKYFIIHPVLPYGWGDEPTIEEAHKLTVERINELLPFAKKEGVVICLENIPLPKGHSFSTMQEFKDVVRAISDSNVKLCYDTGHCNVIAENQYESIKLFGDDLATLHVHDDINHQDRHLIPYQGQIDWQEIVKALGRIGFNGCVSLETSVGLATPEPMKEQMQKAVANIARFIALQIEKEFDK